MGLPGLQKLNIPQNKSTSNASKSNGTSELKHVAARNLATTSRASGATSYGIFAQRSSAGTGAIFSPKQTYGSAIDAQRAYMNANRTIVGNNFYGGHNCSGNYDNGMNKFMAGMMALNMLGELTAQTVNTVKSTKSTEGAGGNDKTATTTSSSTKSLNEMKSAKDSSTLRGAIESAKADKSGMEAELKTLESKLPEMKEASEAATKKLETLKPKLAKAEEAKNTAETNKKDAESVKNANEKAVKGAEEGLQGAKDGLVNAKNGLVNAKQGLGTAKAKLASISPTITNSDGTTVENPAYKEAQEAVKLAEERVKSAEETFKAASEAYDTANEDATKAKSDFEKATEQLANAEENLAQKTEIYNETKTEYDKLKTEVESAEKQKTDYENAVKQQTELQANIKSLDSEIPAQEKRLTELESKESKGLGAAENTILKMNNKLAGQDGILGTEDDKKKLGSKDQKKLDEAKDLQRNVNYTKLYQEQGTKIGNQTFRTGSYDGETLYMIGAKKVDEQEYNLKKGLAEEAQKGTKEANEILNRNLQNALSPELRKRIQGL